MKDHVEKIKKLLALASSTNVHEAALAMAHAQRLMQEHNVTMKDVRLSDVKQSQAHMARAKTPARHLQWLAQCVADAFGCVIIQLPEPTGWDKWITKIQFIGIDSAAELSSYSFDVLRRQLERDRKLHIKTLKRCKRTTKIRRADEFAKAWVRAVASKVRELVPSKEHTSAIQAWKDREYEGALSEAEQRKSKTLKNGDIRSVLAGVAAGSQAQLHAGMGSEDRLRINGGLSG